MNGQTDRLNAHSASAAEKELPIIRLANFSAIEPNLMQAKLSGLKQG
jgi:hypothetical protein